MNNIQTQRMVACPVNRAIVAYVARCGHATRQAILCHLDTLGLATETQIYNLCATAVLVNTTPRKAFALYATGPKAALFLPVEGPATVEAAVRATPQPDPAHLAETKWVGHKAPPRQYDVMHAPVWVPPVNTPARPGATDFLQHASRGHRC